MWRSIMPRWPRTRMLVALVLVVLGSLLVPATQALAEATGSIKGSVTVSRGLTDSRLVGWLYRYVDGSWSLTEGRYVAPDGTWTFNGVTPGTYRVGFTDENDLYRQTFYPDSTTAAVAKDVTVVAGQVTTIGPTALPAYCAISGVVSTAAGPAAGARAIAVAREGTSWLAVESATVDASGAFRIGRLTPGSYRVRFQDPAGALATTHWTSSDTGGTPLLADAADIVIGNDGQVAAGRSVTMVPASSVSGRVTNEQGAAAAVVTAVLYRVLSDGSIEGLAQTQTDANGAYRFDTLSRGSYRVGFSDGRTTVYWPQASTLEKATTVQLAAAEHRTDVDGQLAKPAPVSVPTVALPPPTTVISVDAGTAPSGPSGTTSAPKTTLPGPSVAAGSGVTSPTTTAPKPTPTSLSLVSAPTLTGAAKPGKVLGATTGTWSPTSALLTYRWYAGKKPIPGATMPTLKLTAKLRGKRVRAQVTGSFAGRTIASYTPWSSTIR